jgi:hypothetical protein
MRDYLQIDKSKGIEVYIDADFAGGWSSADADNADNVLLRTGWIGTSGLISGTTTRPLEEN